MTDFLKPKEIVCGITLPHGELFGPGRVAAVLGCSDQHVYNLIRRGELTAIDISLTMSIKPKYKVSRSSLIDFINRRTEGTY
ncbi:MAG: helix-turn-helix domain-containing protein [Kiritimatiellales bacterium]|nr:helix-turn-helix domain-containing protein [Kiritimatiellales bacterium]